MSTPLPDAVSALLRTSATAAMGALMLISVSHRELFSWAARMLGADEPAKIEPRPNGKAKQVRKRNGASRPAKANRSGADAYHQRQRKARDRDDEALLEAMRSAPNALISDWPEAIGKGHSSIILALKRLRDAGLAESLEGKWRLTEPEAPREPPPKWVAPLNAGREHRAHASA
jgi:hypothetical protein